MPYTLSNPPKQIQGLPKFDSDSTFDFGDKLQGIEVSRSEKGRYIMGYVATTKFIDPEKRRFTRPVLENVARTMLNPEHNKVMLFHNLDDIPIAKVAEAKVDDTGLFVKLLLNDAHPRSDEVFNSAQNGFLDGMSIHGRANSVSTCFDESLGCYVKEFDDFNHMETTLTSFPLDNDSRISGTYVARSLNENIFNKGGSTMETNETNEQIEPPVINDDKSEIETLRSEIKALSEKVEKLEADDKTESVKSEAKSDDKSEEVKQSASDMSQLKEVFRSVLSEEINRSLSKENLSEIIASIHAEPTESKAVVKRDLKKNEELSKLPTDLAFTKAMEIAHSKGLI